MLAPSIDTLPDHAAAAAFFSEHGYYHAKGVFSPEEIAMLEIDFDRIVSQLQASKESINARWNGAAMDDLDAAAKTFIIHTHNVQCYSEAWARAFYQERFLSITKAFLGPDIILHHSKLFQKPPEKGAPFPMHQDWGYFPTINDTMIAGIIHVSPATDEMGCLRVVPGSHRLGRLGGTQGMESKENVNSILKEYPLEEALPVEAEPGDVVFFHYFTLHGSKPNRSTETRKTVLVQMHSGSDAMEPEFGHPNVKLVLSGWNHYATREGAARAS